MSKISLTARRNLLVRSSDRTELMEHLVSLQISLNKDLTETIRGAAKPVGS